jgi:hypothetical protein
VFNGLTVLSLVLCVATGVLWVCTYHRPRGLHSLSMAGGYKEVWIGSQTGSLFVQSVWTGSVTREYFEHVWLERLGFVFERQNCHSVGQVPVPRVFFELRLPHWFLIVVFAPPLVLRLMVRRRRAKDGMCQTCGYNLTGNVSGVCPECGKPIALKA